MQAIFSEFQGIRKGEKYKLSYGIVVGTTKMPYLERRSMVKI
ncbi:MAG TPA: hypothetical protein VKA98_09540 [Nitrososphaeraceae archaeon]|nr:hypothetical protein [Nitrososphaeraceae archaeon]